MLQSMRLSTQNSVVTTMNCMLRVGLCWWLSSWLRQGLALKQADLKGSAQPQQPDGCVLMCTNVCLCARCDEIYFMHCKLMTEGSTVSK